MSNTNPARGMRDFLPADIRKREFVIGIIKDVYEKYGFEPLETPSVENLDTLTNKYGEEGDQLMFKILKRGEKLQRELSGSNENELSDLALRYDLTVPLARVVANYKNDLPKFFKRYQIQPVWRADRPARGRYREFYQCDVDAIGSSSMIVEAELCAAVSEILEKLEFKEFTIYLNHRDILFAILDVVGIPTEKQIEALVLLDKIDKIGHEKFEEELIKLKIERKQVETLISFMREFYELGESNERNILDVSSIIKLNNDLLDLVARFIKGNYLGENAIKHIRKVLDLSPYVQFMLFDVGLARGLSYYTGAIFEINIPDFQGSIAGGGRYDGLIGMFGKEQIPAVGFSLGLERILLIMEERGMFPDDLTTNSADVMITLWNEETAGESLKLANELREQNLRVLVYPEADKLGKQFKYADSLNIPFVCILGENELAENKVSVKNLKTGEQETVAKDEIAGKMKT